MLRGDNNDSELESVIESEPIKDSLIPKQALVDDAEISLNALSGNTSF